MLEELQNECACEEPVLNKDPSSRPLGFPLLPQFAGSVKPDKKKTNRKSQIVDYPSASSGCQSTMATVLDTDEVQELLDEYASELISSNQTFQNGCHETFTIGAKQHLNLAKGTICQICADGPAGVPYTVTEGRVNLAVAFKNHEKELERRGFSVNIFKEYKYDYEKL